MKLVLAKKFEDIGSELKGFIHFKKEAGDRGLDLEGFERAVEHSGINASQTATRELFNALDPNRFFFLGGAEREGGRMIDEFVAK